MEQQFTADDVTLDQDPAATTIDEVVSKSDVEVNAVTAAKPLWPPRRPGWLVALPITSVGLVCVALAEVWKDWSVAAIVTMISAGLSMRLFDAEQARLTEKQAEELSKSGAPILSEAIATLEAWKVDRYTRDVALSLLENAIPRLTAEDAATLTATDRHRLYSALFQPVRYDSEDLQLGVIELAGLLGDPAAIPAVSRMAQIRTVNARQLRVRDAAAACLQRLGATVPAETDLIYEEDVGEVVTTIVATGPVSTSRDEMPAELKRVLDLLGEERKRHHAPAMRNGFLMASWLVIFPYTVVKLIENAAASDPVGSAIWAALAVVCTQLRRFALSQRQSELARALAGFNDVRAIGPLAEALDWPDTDDRRTAAVALIRLLPHLHASDAGLLNETQRFALYRNLDRAAVGEGGPGGPMLQEAILKALEQVGDHTAIPYVEQVANLKGRGNHVARLRDAANHCLPYLRVRAGQIRASQTLLRASGPSAESDGDLLRPATDSQEREAESLLRPGLDA